MRGSQFDTQCMHSWPSKQQGRRNSGRRSLSIPYQALSWFDIGQLDFFQAGRLAHQGVRGGSHGLITDVVQNLRLQRKRQNNIQKLIQ